MRIAVWTMVGLGLGAALWAAPASAGGLVAQARQNPQETAKFWTSERYRDARPFTGSSPAAADLADLASVNNEDAAAAATAAPEASGEGQAPLPGLRANLARRLFDPASAASPAPADAADAAGENTVVSGLVERAAGSTGALFTSAHLVPTNADLSYPYLTVGRLYFTNSAHNTFYCSAAVLRPRVVVTAAQCLYGSAFYTNIQFVPAYRSGSAPFGTWNASYIIVHNNWISTHGVLPNATDYGLVEIQDQVVNGATRRLGDVTGYLGYVIQKLRPNHAHILAYTSTGDNGERVHQVTGQSFRATAQTNVEYGSDMRGGSQGGPIVQDFGDNAALVKWIGALSYFYTSRKN